MEWFIGKIRYPTLILIVFALLVLFSLMNSSNPATPNGASHWMILNPRGRNKQAPSNFDLDQNHRKEKSTKTRISHANASFPQEVHQRPADHTKEISSMMFQWLYCTSEWFSHSLVTGRRCFPPTNHPKTSPASFGRISPQKRRKSILKTITQIRNTAQPTETPSTDSSRLANSSPKVRGTESKMSSTQIMDQANSKPTQASITSQSEKSKVSDHKDGTKYWSKFDFDRIERRLSKIGKEVGLKPVQKIMDRLQSNGTFMDLKYDGSWKHLKSHWRRLAMIVLHYKDQMTPVLEKVIRSYEFMANTVPQPKGSNWWIHLIGVPEHIWESLLIARNYLPQHVVRKILNKFYVNTIAGPVWCPSERNGQNAGSNLAPRALIGLGEAFLRNNLETFLAELKPLLHRELVTKRTWDNNGLREDGCIHHHNLRVNIDNSTKLLGQVHNNNYGKELLQNFAAIIWIVSKTRFSFGEEIEEALYWAFFECEQWLYRGNTVDPATTGRKIDSGNVVTYYGGLAAVRRTLLYLQRIGRHQEKIKAAIHRYRNPFPKPQYALEGNRHFFSSDLMAHQRQNFSAVLRLLSRRTVRPESWSTQNSKGYYLGDGFLSVLVNSREFGSLHREVFQVYDWAHIPGATIIDSEPVPEIPTKTEYVSHCYNNATFVGGSSNGMNGVAAMIYSRPTVPVRGRKSWHFFSDVIVSVGTGIKRVKENSIGHVSTTINQVLYCGNFTYFDGSIHFINASQFFLDINTVSEKSWFHHGDIGYVPLTFPEEVHVEVQERPLKSSYIPLFTLWWGHGNLQSASNYSHAILPSASIGQTAAFSHNPNVQLLEMSDEIHMVYESHTRTISAAVFEPSQCLNVESLDCALNQICFNQPNLFTAQLASIEFCENDEETKKKLHTNIEETCEQMNQPNCTSEGFNRSANNSDWLLISIADPTGSLAEIEMTFKTQQNTIVHKILLPTGSISGKSVNICFPLL